MGRFVAHRYTAKKTTKWVNLMLKYYHGKPVTPQYDSVTHAGFFTRLRTFFFGPRVPPFPCPLTQDLFNQVPDDTPCTIETPRIWSGHEAQQVWPPYVHTAARPCPEELKEVVRDIRQIYAMRASFGGREVAICSNSSYTLRPDQVREAVEASLNEHVTHYFYSAALQEALVIITGHFPILVTCTKAADASWPVLDFDDGFETEDWDAPELQQQFLAWRQDFDDPSNPNFQPFLLRH